MFPNLHRSEELCFQISPNPQKKKTNFSKDHILDHYEEIIASSQTPISLTKSTTLVNYDSATVTQIFSDNKSKEMMKHRDIERQRRQEMAALHASLRSLLPLELIKGKRSISDHINEGANYIKQLQMKIKELDAKRDALKRYNYLSNGNIIMGPSSTTDNDHHSSSALCQDNLIRVQPWSGGLEIVISSTGDASALPMSKILQVILEEGLSVVSCISTKVNGILLHTIKAEAHCCHIELHCSDNYLSALYQKLKKCDH
ncbi:hypothetical protein CsatB_003491 [Cannabis sativa]